MVTKKLNDFICFKKNKITCTNIEEFEQKSKYIFKKFKVMNDYFSLNLLFKDIK